MLKNIKEPKSRLPSLDKYNDIGENRIELNYGRVIDVFENNLNQIIEVKI